MARNGRKSNVNPNEGVQPFVEPDKKKKKEVPVVLPNLDRRPKGVESKDFIASKIGGAWGDKQRREVYFPIPKNEKECMDRYKITVFDTEGCLAGKGVSNISTGGPYQDAYDGVEVSKDGKLIMTNAVLKPNGHNLLQDIADKLFPGKRSVSTGKRAEAARDASTVSGMDALIAMMTSGEITAEEMGVRLAEARAKEKAAQEEIEKTKAQAAKAE